MTTRIIVLCTGNSARSQMAEGLFRHLGAREIEVVSAGTKPRPEINPLAVAAMDEIGIDIRHQYPKDVANFAGQRFDYAITVCDRARESCPIFPGGEARHWSFPDPAEVAGSREERLQAFRDVRTGLEERINLLIAEARSAMSG